MIRQLTTLVVCGVLGSTVLVGSAEACHKRTCGHAPVVCAAPRPRALRHVRSVCAQGQALRLQAADVLPQEGGLCAGPRGLVCPGSRVLLLRRTRHLRRAGQLSRRHPSGFHAALMA